MTCRQTLVLQPDVQGETVKASSSCARASRSPRLMVIEFCRSKLAHYKCPTTVEQRDVLTRTATGKLQKFKLRAPHWEGFRAAGQLKTSVQGLGLGSWCQLVPFHFSIAEPWVPSPIAQA